MEEKARVTHEGGRMGGLEKNRKKGKKLLMELVKHHCVINLGIGLPWCVRVCVCV